jgi:hypothetical protein
MVRPSSQRYHHYHDHPVWTGYNYTKGRSPQGNVEASNIVFLKGAASGSGKQLHNLVNLSWWAVAVAVAVMVVVVVVVMMTMTRCG